MFRLPTTRALLRNGAPSSARLFSELTSPPAPRAFPPAYERSSLSHLRHYDAFRSRSSIITRALLQPPPHLSPRLPGRPFSSTSAPRAPRYGNDSYRRFGGHGGRRPPIMVLLKSIQPQHIVIAVVIIGGFYFYNVETVEMTGRRRFNCVSAERELKMGQDSYNEVINSTRGKILPASHPLTQMVDRVLRRLIPEAPIEGADWRVHVIQDDGQKNAFVLPGGKVFVFTGILPICRDEDGLAAVLGHEIAHVVAHHPAERMSNSLVTLGLVFLISSLFDISGQVPNILLNLMYSLPNSRKQEAEADNIGLMMMSKACFNPEAAAELWRRMQEAEKLSPPQFLSTHPTSYNREEAIRQWLPGAERIYESSGCHAMGSYMPHFRQASNTYGW